MKKLFALIKKETLQIIRDPSSIMIAFVLPLILLFIFGYGINLDSNSVRIGLVLEDTSPDVTSLSKALADSKFLDVSIESDKRNFEDQLVAGKIRSIIVIPQNLSARMSLSDIQNSIQIITDGSEPNIASFVQNYVQGAIQIWFKHQAEDRGLTTSGPLISVEPRFWFNPELKSRNFLVPGSIAIIMTLIGTLLTALVIAREWERGTMELLLATPITVRQILIGKLIPYFFLGICSMAFCLTVATCWYNVPFRGSFIALFICSSFFLVAALGQGLLISSMSKDQFVASQIALMSAFLPAFMLSGFIFEISAMPLPIRAITNIVTAKYFVKCLQTLFLAGNVWALLIPSTLAMMLISIIFFGITARKTTKLLDV